jgi:hypothetical protein
MIFSAARPDLAGADGSAQAAVVGAVGTPVCGLKGNLRRDSLVRRIAAPVLAGVIGALALRPILGARSAS